MLSNKGTNSKLQTQIQDFVNTHSALKLNTQFVGLFQKERCQNTTQVLVEAECNNKKDDDDQDGHPSLSDDDQQTQHMTSGTAVCTLQSNTIPLLLLHSEYYYFPQSNPDYATVHYNDQPHYSSYLPILSTSTTNLQHNYYFTPSIRPTR